MLCIIKKKTAAKTALTQFMFGLEENNSFA